MNKLLARVVAVVMAIAMLGTVSFAASYDAGTVKPAVDGRADTAETVLVFATNTPNDKVFDGTDKIVAIAQAADVPTSIPVDADAVKEYDYITIAYGGNGADTATQYAFLDVRGEVALTAIIAAKTLTLVDDETGEEVTYTNVAYAQFTVPADGTVIEYGVKFNSYASEEAKEAKDGAEEVVINNIIDGVAISGSATFGAVIMGVPYDTFTEGTVIKATPYVVYAQ